MNPKLVYIAGAARSGSTLLNLLLGNSSEMTALGEVHRLALYARTNAEPCTCGRPVTSCEFWSRVEEEGRALLGRPRAAGLLGEVETMMLRSAISPAADILEKAALLSGSRALWRAVSTTVARPHGLAIARSLFWLDVVRRVTGRPIVVDSSKDARRMKALFLADPGPFFAIDLRRDGRAVVASAMRRLGVDAETASREWVSRRRGLDFSFKTIPPERVLRLRYKDLCENPPDTMRQIARFVGFSYSEELVRLRKDNDHGIGGNPMRFRRDEEHIRHDDRWQAELKPRDLATFRRVAGRLNRAYGYYD